ncbi:sugar phosphorylase [Halobacillus massiliensis]|uniref:sugar phosphorylase n=1 Tax=Halobacillus massiliensis TaxID=1926286 RepID=UPI0009E2C89F|nr:sugar phosphorylase [Halobacillus massiliensis]
MNKSQLLQKIELHLEKIYHQVNEKDLSLFKDLIDRWSKEKWQAAEAPSEENIYLIAYGDSVIHKNEPTLPVLHKFLTEEAGDLITDVHLLPMFPYTSDDGFSVVDYRLIDPKLGEWNDINRFSRDFRMMYDFVANHISQSSHWFKGYLNDDPKYKNYFIPEDPDFDTSQVVRPRTSPLFHQYENEKTAWTTFSEDQVDVNFKHIPVLVEMTDILLEYAYNGAAGIRLDAIGFIWKESGTSSIHLPQAHEIIKLWHTILNAFKPNTQIITETNVPHKENISYFGNSEDEANMVYQFSLPPLVLYSLMTHNARKLSDWAKTINKVSDDATYFNFLASHDGIGMRPAEGILTEQEKQSLVEQVQRNGGKVSYKSNPDGSQSVYELNINYSEALINKGEDTTEDLQIQKMLAAHSILLSVIGVPAIYYHSLLGSSNDYQGLKQSGIPRRINREKLEYETIKKELVSSSRRSGIFNGLKDMMAVRKQESAFSPYAHQEVIDIDDRIFSLKRRNSESDEEIFFAVNTSTQPVQFSNPYKNAEEFTVLHGNRIEETITLGAYEFIWVKR